MDDTDDHEFECALRETEEEIGLSSEYIDVRVFRQFRVS
jgi:8-oxo-dGTP pyrophosphatase MutT (NUDIX family)